MICPLLAIQEETKPSEKSKNTTGGQKSRIGSLNKSKDVQYANSQRFLPIRNGHPYTASPPKKICPLFQVVAMDLITGLPMQRGLDAILTIVDHGCSRVAIFLPCSIHISRAGVTQLYLNHIYPWYGLPQKVISDKDPRFTSHFGKALTKQLGI